MLVNVPDTSAPKIGPLTTSTYGNKSNFVSTMRNHAAAHGGGTSGNGTLHLNYFLEYSTKKHLLAAKTTGISKALRTNCRVYILSDLQD